MATLYQQMQSQREQQMRVLIEDHQNEIALVRTECASKIEEIKKSKERESKKAREEAERTKKSLEEKLKKAESDWVLERD